MQRDRFFTRIGLILGGIVILCWSLFPVYWITVSPLRGYDGFFPDSGNLWPTDFKLEYFETVVNSTNFPVYFLNSVVVALIATVVTVILSTFMAYALTRFKFRGSSVLLNSMLIGYMLPPLLLAIPLVVIFIDLKIDDTLLALSIAHIAMSLPFGVWMLVSFFRTIPFDLEEAAWIDGVSRFGTIWRIIFPLILPGILSVAVFTFIISFTDYVFGLMIVSSDLNKTIPVGLASIKDSTSLTRGELLAGAALIAVPMVILFSFITKFFIRGLTAGAVKG